MEVWRLNSSPGRGEVEQDEPGRDLVVGEQIPLDEGEDEDAVLEDSEGVIGQEVMRRDGTVRTADCVTGVGGHDP